MAKKVEEPKYIDAILVVQKEKFKSQLEVQIEKGEQLLSIDVPVINQGNINYSSLYGIRKSENKVQYEEGSRKSFIADFNRWHNVNIEIYKSSFSVPNNTYRKDYESNVWPIWGDDIKKYKDVIGRLINQMKGDIEKLPFIKGEDADVKDPTANSITVSKNKIFIVHGHDEKLKEKVARTILQLGLLPIVLHEQVDEGRTIIEKFEANAEDCGFAIILLTADDLGQSIQEQKQGEKPKNRARQNVVFEMGYFMGRLTRKRVFTLLDKDVDKPGDLEGLVYVTTKNEYEWKVRLGRELRNCGYNVDMNKIL